MATFEGATAAGAIQAFLDSVDDDLAMSEKHGIEPECAVGVLTEAS